MPFDALVAVERPRTLSAVLAACGLTAVDDTTLADHKRAQCAQFGPSFWYRHQLLLAGGLLASIGLMALTGGLANAAMAEPSPMPAYISLGWLAVMAGLISCGTVRLRAGAHWEERWLPADRLEQAGVPAPIAAAARLVREELPGATLILGELIQENVLLDPYLVIEHGGQRACLGIWDGAQIIAHCR